MPAEDDLFTSLGSVRHALSLAGIASLSDLAAKTETEMLKMFGVRPYHLTRIRRVLADHGLQLAG
jgi:hypothetical protein